MYQKKLYSPFYGWGSTVSEPLRGDSLLFINLSAGVPGTHLTDIGRMKG